MRPLCNCATSARSCLTRPVARPECGPWPLPASPGPDSPKRLALVESLARPPEDDYQGELLDRYRRVRRFWPCLLRTVTFQATQAGRPLVNALSILASLEDQREPDLSRLPLDVVSRAWRRFVVNSDRTIDRRGYTLCVLYRLQDGLRRRDVFVDRSERWGDPRAKLLHGTEWEAARSQVCLSLGRQVTGFHGIVIPGTLRDSLFILEGLLEQETSRSCPTPVARACFQGPS